MTLFSNCLGKYQTMTPSLVVNLNTSFRTSGDNIFLSFLMMIFPAYTRIHARNNFKPARIDKDDSNFGLDHFAHCTLCENAVHVKGCLTII